jgi:hypothetical protein
VPIASKSRHEGVRTSSSEKCFTGKREKRVKQYAQNRWMLMFQVPPPAWLDPAIFLADLAWVLLRSFVTFVICFCLGLGGVKLLDVITPGIKEVRSIRGHPLSTALFAAGMFIFLGFTFVGSVVAPLPIGISSGLGAIASPLLIFGYRILTLLAGFLISTVFASVFYGILGKVEPFGIDLHDVSKDSVATGVYVMSYLIFLGIVLYASLLLPA